jgi:hypothetical protein
MSRYAVAKKLSPTEAAYIAGIVDGEGTITLTRRNSNKQRHLILSVSNTELRLLRHIRLVTGVGKITQKRVYSERHAIGYTYGTSNRHALDIIRAIRPYLQTHKRLRARLVLENYLKLTPRNGKYTPAMFRKREKFIEKFFEIGPSITKTRKGGLDK